MAFTYFFRDTQTLTLAAQGIAALYPGRPFIHIWDAGCASGEEPYTLTILLAKEMGRYTFRNVSVDASDLNQNFGKIIQQGSYPQHLLQRIPESIFKQYFSPGAEHHYTIIKEIRQRIHFHHHDLLTLKPVTVKKYTLIVCKNVLLHFSPEMRIKVIQMFYDALAPEGFLVMEHTQKLPTELQGKFTQFTPAAQIYRRL